MSAHPDNPIDENKPGSDSDNVEDTENLSLPLEQLARSLYELLGAYPFFYIQNYVGGNVIGGAVGPKSRVRTGKIKVESQTSDTGRPEDVSTASSKTPSFKDAVSLENWFFETNLDNQIHIILVAIFAGNALKFVDAARELLKQSLASRVPKAETDDTPQTPQPFRRGTTNVLEATQTTTAKAKYVVESGETEVITVEFIDPGIQKYALAFLRSSVDLEPLRATLIEWLIQVCTMDQIGLRALGVAMIDLTRSQAAIGLGELAKEDYGYYLSFIIRPWARSQDPFLRFVVGWVLFALATESKYRSTVFSLLTHWAKSHSNYLKWTAAAACSRVGLIDIDETLKIIKVLLGTNSPYILYAVRVSIGLLYLSAKNAYKIIEVFVSWLQSSEHDDSQNLINNIPLVFLSLAQGKFADDMEFNDEGEVASDSQLTRIGLWDLIGREIDQGKSTLLTCVSALIQQGFYHERAYIVDWTCDLIEEWIIEADKKNNDQAFVNAVCQVLILLRKDRVALRYINRLLASKRFANSSTAMRIKRAYDVGGYNG